jgi:hypothetical protein
MAMTRVHSSVTHLTAVLVFDFAGHVTLMVAGRSLGVFVGLRLPRRHATATPPQHEDERLEG